MVTEGNPKNDAGQFQRESASTPEQMARALESQLAALHMGAALAALVSSLGEQPDRERLALLEESNLVSALMVARRVMLLDGKSRAMVSDLVERLLELAREEGSGQRG